MFFSLVKKEMLGHILSFRFVMVFVLFVGLTPVSVLLMTWDYHQARQLFQAGRDLQWEVLNQVRAIPSLREQADVIGDYGIYDGVRPQPLSLFVRGIEDLLPYQAHACWNFSREIFKAAYRNPVFELFPAPDFGYVVHVVHVVASLVALLFMFDAVSGEKERGTLRLMLAHPVDRYRILLSKWLGGYLVLAAPFLVAFLGSVTAVYLMGEIRLAGDLPVRLAGLVGVSLLYLALFCSLGLMVSALAGGSSTALLVALFVWVGWVLVIPNLSPPVARAVAPSPYEGE